MESIKKIKMENQPYFALWAEDINRYLSTAYNCTKISDVKRALLEYISVDQDNSENIYEAELIQILNMTGLILEYSIREFGYTDIENEMPISNRVGFKVKSAFIA